MREVRPSNIATFGSTERLQMENEEFLRTQGTSGVINPTVSFMEAPVLPTCVGTIPKTSVLFTTRARGSSPNVSLTNTSGIMAASSQIQPVLQPPYGTIRTTAGGLLEPSLIGSQSQSTLRTSDLSSLATVVQQPPTTLGRGSIGAGVTAPFLQPRGLTSGCVISLME